MKKLIIALSVVILASCTTTEKVTTKTFKPGGLHYTGQYHITSRTGTLTTFKELKGSYDIACDPDTLKVGDVVTINVISHK